MKVRLGCKIKHDFIWDCARYLKCDAIEIPVKANIFSFAKVVLRHKHLHINEKLRAMPMQSGVLFSKNNSRVAFIPFVKSSSCRTPKTLTTKDHIKTIVERRAKIGANDWTTTRCPQPSEFKKLQGYVGRPKLLVIFYHLVQISLP